jgi:carbon storage regulator CsrA
MRAMDDVRAVADSLSTMIATSRYEARTAYDGAAALEFASAHRCQIEAAFFRTEARMLILSRRSQEAVVVGGSGGFERLLKVTVLEINRGTVRLGFEVDKEVPVHRLEVWQRIHADDVADTRLGSRAPPETQ